jgi:hypothetical protein
VTVSVTGSELSLRLSILMAPVLELIVTGGVLPRPLAVAPFTCAAFQQPENTAFEISWPGPGLVPLSCHTKVWAPAGGTGVVRVVV